MTATIAQPRPGAAPPARSPARCELCGSAGLEPVVASGAALAALECPTCRIRFRSDPPTEGGNGDPLTVERAHPALSRSGWSKRLRIVRRLQRGRLLDVSCGDGLFLEMARGLGFQVLGTERCRYTSARTAQWLNAPVYCGDLADLDLPPGSVDVVTSWNGLDRTPRPGAELQAIRAVLGPDGIALLAVCNRRAPFTRHPDRLPDGSRGITFWDPAVLEHALAHHGFEVLDLRSDPAGTSGLDRIAEGLVRSWSVLRRRPCTRGVVALARATGGES